MGGMKKMKKVFKLGCLGVIGLVVLIAVAAMAFGGGGDDTATNGGAAKPAEEKKATTAKMNEVLNVGDAAFTITGKETAAQVGPSVLPETASGKYLVLDVTFKNNGNEAIMVDSSFFKLKLGEKTYEADDVASISANQSEDGSIDMGLFYEEVNPDSEVKGKVVFDVTPEVADSTELQVQVQSGMFGTETGIINLQ